MGALNQDLGLEKMDSLTLEECIKKPASPVNVFEHKLFFRVIHPGSPPRSRNGDLRSRLYPPPKIRDIEAKNLEQKVNAHGWGRIEDTPFISGTTDPLRAFSRALSLVGKGITGVTVLVIDSWKLHTGSFVPCNDLRTHVGLDKEHLFDTEVIVWAEIPAAAIVCDWLWEVLEVSGLFGFGFFPGLAMRKSLELQNLRKSLVFPPGDFSAYGLAGILVYGLEMPPSAFFTHQIGLMIMGWAKYYSRVDEYPRLQGKLGRNAASEVSLFQRELYKKEICVGNEAKDCVKEFLGKMSGLNHSLFIPSLIQWIYRSCELSFDDWLEKREELYREDQEPRPSMESQADTLWAVVEEGKRNGTPIEIVE